MAESSARASKASQQQFEIMVEFMENHRNLLTGKINPYYTAKDRQREWEELCQQLNSEGTGPQKDEKKWRKTWTDWKSSVKIKAAKLNGKMTQTGGGSMPTEKLTHLEERLLSLYGSVWIEGMGTVAESSFGTLIPEMAEGNKQCNVQYNTENITYDVELIDVAVTDDNQSPYSPEQAIPEGNCRKKRKTDVINDVAEKYAEGQDKSCDALIKIACAIESLSKEHKKRNEIEDRKVHVLEKLGDQFICLLQNMKK